MLDLIIRGLAVSYLAVAGVEFSNYLLHRFNPRVPDVPVQHAPELKRLKFLNNKPFNCVLCLSFWFALPVASVPIKYLIVLAIAGISILVGAVYYKLRMYMA